MSTPYRDRTCQCPNCGAGLRQHATRWICDACGGMQLSHADFQSAIEDLTMEPAKLAWGDGTPGHPCPQCPEVMTRAALDKIVLAEWTVGPRVELERCPHHGPWFASNQLADVFTAIERRQHVGQPRPGPNRWRT